MKYKVGDKLKMKSKVDWAEVEYNDVVEVIEVEGVSGNSPYSVESKLGYRIWVEEEDLEPLTNIIEVNGKKYEQCSEDEWYNVDYRRRRIEHRYYKEVKEEFRVDLTGASVVEEELNGEKLLCIGGSFRVRPDDMERVLKEYKEYLKQ